MPAVPPVLESGMGGSDPNLVPNPYLRGRWAGPSPRFGLSEATVEEGALADQIQNFLCDFGCWKG